MHNLGLAVAWWRRKLGGDSFVVAAKAPRWWQRRQQLDSSSWAKWEWDICSGDGSATAQRRWCLAQAAQRWQLRRCSSAAFVLGRGRRDDGANGVIVGDSGARGDVHSDSRSADYAEGCADDIIC
jgi:hypothetical protein